MNYYRCGHSQSSDCRKVSLVQRILVGVLWLVVNQTVTLPKYNEHQYFCINIRLKEIKGGTVKNNFVCKISAINASLYAYNISNKYIEVANQIYSISA